MFLIGLLLLIIGLATGITVLFWVGVVLLVIGLVGNGRAYSGRGRYWY